MATLLKELEEKFTVLKRDVDAERSTNVTRIEAEKNENLKKISLLENCLNESNQQILTLRELFTNMKGEVESITKDVTVIKEKDQDLSMMLAASKVLPKNSRIFQSSEEYVRSLVGELQFSPERATVAFSQTMFSNSKIIINDLK